MKITGITSHVLLVPAVDVDATSSAQDAFVVEIETDAGITGIGESDLNPWIARACLDAPATHTMGRNLRDMLLGEDPRDPVRLWQKLYEGSAMNGRRGAVIHVIGALDMALWDIAGKAAGMPVWRLLAQAGTLVQAAVTPYASLLPPAPSYATFKATMVEWAVRAKELGFVAAKLETLVNGPYRHGA